MSDTSNRIDPLPNDRAEPPGAPRRAARPELLAPAGDADCLRAAVENGADAVYFGLDHGFNARARAVNFPIDELAGTMRGLHRRGVRGYVTLNTLVFPAELPEMERTIRRVAESGADAVLVQDLGVARLIREVCPDFPIHASTQMSLTSAENILVAEELGIERVVLARELSIEEIRAIHRRCGIVLEVFVHGALCVAYSGQCLTSESLGGRSANRGQCAQACRLPYELVRDGKDVDLGDVRYLLSPQDLAAHDLIGELIDAGAGAFKIEGRLKTAEYVANITSHYRHALDAALAGRPERLDPREVDEMELAFSRGFSAGWLRGDDHKALVPGLGSANRGVRLGTVTRVRGRRVSVRLVRPVKPGDGIVFAGDRARCEEQGGRVFGVFVDDRPVEHAVDSGIAEIVLARGAIDPSTIFPGQVVWKTDDPELARRWRKTFAGETPRRKIALRCSVRAAVGEPLVVTARAENGGACEVRGDERLAAARNRPADQPFLAAQLGRLGATPYELVEFEGAIEGEPMVPLSMLGRIRHAMIERLEESAGTPASRTIGSPDSLERLRADRNRSARRDAPSEPSGSLPILRVLCRAVHQIEAVLEVGARNLYADFPSLDEMRRAASLARNARAELVLATPRIQKPGEIGLFRAMAKLEPDGVLVRNLAGLAFFRDAGISVVADFSLNTANDLSFAFLRDRGAVRVVPSYDLNRDQLSDLVSACGPWGLEIVAHQHMPLFHMAHCVFCAVMSPGHDRTDCGRPCDAHTVRLRDRVGMEHPLLADVGCRNTLFNAVAQSAAEVVPALIANGIRDFRVELLDEDSQAARRVVELYADLLAGRARGRDVWRTLRAANRVGVTRGTLEERRDPLAIL